ncbi:VOC family protein [Mycobacterium sp. WMMD1722]|uniref:VOC family protein n=1 Tax=Mycobacterium sp. WMMD1722 TaxID=3404117 RepID=UPI003BF5E5CC
MALTVEMITFDCADPDGLADWWSKVAGGDVNALAPGDFVMVTGDGRPTLGFQRVPDPTPGKNKVHLDFSAEDRDAEVTRLKSLGATETGRHSFGDEFSWVVMADPEGNAFCVAGG